MHANHFAKFTICSSDNGTWFAKGREDLVRAHGPFQSCRTDRWPNFLVDKLNVVDECVLRLPRRCHEFVSASLIIFNNSNMTNLSTFTAGRLATCQKHALRRVLRCCNARKGTRARETTFAAYQCCKDHEVSDDQAAEVATPPSVQSLQEFAPVQVQLEASRIHTLTQQHTHTFSLFVCTSVCMYVCMYVCR